jgi:hypothetical protein
LYDSIVKFLHNSEAIGQLRSQTMNVDFNNYGIQNELPVLQKNPSKKRNVAKRTTKNQSPTVSPATKRSVRNQTLQPPPSPPMTRNNSQNTAAIFIDDNQTADVGETPATNQDETFKL